MMVLDLPTLTFEVIQGAGKTTTDGTWTTAYKNISKGANETYSHQHGSTNGTNAVTIIPQPKAGDKHIVKSITFHNADSVSQTVIIRVNDGSSTYTIYKATLATLETLVYEDKAGWTAYTSAGARK